MRSVSLFVVLFSAPFLHAKPVDSAVHVKMELNGEWFAGSGTVICSQKGQSLILTAAHVASSPQAQYTVTLNKKEYAAKWLSGTKVTYFNLPDGTQHVTIDGVDLALLVVEDKLPAVELSLKPMKKGDRIHQYGFAGGQISEFGPHYKTGFVVDPDALWSTADARRGDSGSGLFNDKEQLVGVIYKRALNDDVVGGLAIPIGEVTEWLKNNAKDWKLTINK